MCSDSSRLRISNNSSLKRLPSILRDLTIAFGRSSFVQQGLIGESGFTINLYDGSSKTTDTSASVNYNTRDTLFYLRLNRPNRQATDQAIAATLIHEFMHCLLIDIDKRGRSGDKIAWSIIERFNKRIENRFEIVGNNFFDLMNLNESGQHELMYQLFFCQMVTLLEDFSKPHKSTFCDDERAVSLMWSGLQGTSGFQKLSAEQKMQIQLVIMEEKGLSVGPTN
jgi:hypothetical protein